MRRALRLLASRPVAGRACGACLAALLSLPALRAQQTIYTLPADVDTLLTWGGHPVAEGLTYADDVHFGGSSRLLQQVGVAVISDVARSATMELALYGRNPADGLPGPLLWSETRLLNIPAPLSYDDLVRQQWFGPVGLVVPGDLVWAVTFTNIDPYDPTMGESSFFGLIWNSADNLVTAGSEPGASNNTARAFSRQPGGAWQELGGPVNGGVTGEAVFTATFLATDLVPEPSTFALLLPTAAAAFARRRRPAPAA